MATSPFIILSTQRSGSTLLRTSLDSHPDIQCFGEIFLPTYTRDYSFYQFLKDERISGAGALLRRPTLVERHLSNLYENDATAAVGFKVMYNQVGYLPYRFPSVMTYARRHNVRIIHLVRSNPLNTVISRRFARATKQYHTQEQRSAKPVHIDLQMAVQGINRIEKDKARWRQALAGLPCLEVSYEEFVANKSDVSHQILSFLNVNQDVELDSPLKKVINSSLEHLITNYDDLVAALQQSGLERFLPAHASSV
jgi:LPS sulfotransferase NodH